MSHGNSTDDGSDNPVNMNVVPMIDILFCLCVFFMCSFKFKELEGRLGAWLPKDLGNGPMLTDPPPEIRVALTWDSEQERTVRRFGQRTVDSDDELSALLSSMHADYVLMGRDNVPVTVDGDERVPWNQVVSVLDMAKRLGIERVELARGPAAIAR